MDDSAINIAMLDLINERDFLIESSTENNVALPPFVMSITLRDDPILWARKLRELLDVQLDEQYKCASPRKF